MRGTYNFFTLFLLCLLLIACANQPSTDNSEIKQIDSSKVLCKEPRPKICTREYRPVCATVNNDIQCDTENCTTSNQKTYATGCTACADSRVLSYEAGKCQAK